MSSASMMPAAGAMINATRRKPTEKARESVTRKRHHEVPSTLMPCLKSEIVGSLRAGRSVEQTRKEFNCSAAVALELWLRDMERRMAVVMRPAMATACLLAGLCVFDAWDSARHDDGQPNVQRAFRARRVKRGRRERETADSVWMEPPVWAA